MEYIHQMQNNSIIIANNHPSLKGGCLYYSPYNYDHMNRITIGFTAIIAIISMSFTLVSKTGKIAKADLLDGCYTFVTIHVGIPPQTVVLSRNSAIYNGKATICIGDREFPAILQGSYCLITSPGSYGDIVEDPYTQCPMTSNPPVCCYMIENNKVVCIRFGLYTPPYE